MFASISFCGIGDKVRNRFHQLVGTLEAIYQRLHQMNPLLTLDENVVALCNGFPGIFWVVAVKAVAAELKKYPLGSCDKVQTVLVKPVRIPFAYIVSHGTVISAIQQFRLQF